MTPLLNAETQRLIHDRMKRGGYPTPDELIVAALASLEQQERFGDFATGELDRLVAEGEARGGFLDGEQALAQRRQRRAAGRSEPPAKSA